MKRKKKSKNQKKKNNLYKKENKNVFDYLNNDAKRSKG